MHQDTGFLKQLLQRMKDRRQNLPFDPKFFEKKKERDKEPGLRSTFTEIYRDNHWAGDDSVSGEGSGRGQTQILKARLPELLEDLRVDTLLDLPCGDLNWIGEIELPVESYIGGDVVADLIQQNRKNFGHAEQKTFRVLDLTTDPLPDADLILCRDCLVHFSFDDCARALRNLKDSSITWLLATTFPDCTQNDNICTGDWRVLNLELPPFNFPSPQHLVNEQCTEGGGQFKDKSLGLWRIEDLPWMYNE